MTVSPLVMALIHLCASFVFALSLKHIVWFEVVQWWKRQQKEAPRALPAPEGEQGANNAPEADEALSPEQATNNGDRVRTYLEEYPGATVREVAEALSISTSTANKWMLKARSGEQANK